MTPHFAVDCLLAVALALFIVIGVVLLWRKRLSPGFAAVGAAVGMAGFGAAVGWAACLMVCEFVAVLSTSGDDGYVSFAFFWQNEFHPLLTYASRRQVESVAESLNFRLRVAGAAAGATIALGVSVLIWKYGTSAEHGAEHG